MFIQTESTPNPDSFKFLPGKEVLPRGSRDFRSFREAQVSPLAKKIFQMDGVTGVFLSSDFVTVSKDNDADWLVLKPQVFAGIMDFYAEGNVILGPKHGPHQTSGAKRVTLRTRVRGPEPGYVATPIMVSECAMVLLGEGQKVRSGLGGGGVYTPGRVFLDTSLVERLGRAGVVFEVVEDERRGTEGMETTPGEGKRKDR